MNNKVKQAGHYGGSTLRHVITAIVVIAGTMDLIPESKADAITAALMLLANLVWSNYAKRKALKEIPLVPEVKYEKSTN